MTSRTGSGSPGLCAEVTGRLEVEDLTCFLRRAGRHLDRWTGSALWRRELASVWSGSKSGELLLRSPTRLLETTHFSREDIFSERQRNGIKKKC